MKSGGFWVCTCIHIVWTVWYNNLHMARRISGYLHCIRSTNTFACIFESRRCPAALAFNVSETSKVSASTENHKNSDCSRRCGRGFRLYVTAKPRRVRLDIRCISVQLFRWKKRVTGLYLHSVRLHAKNHWPTTINFRPNWTFQREREKRELDADWRHLVNVNCWCCQTSLQPNDRLTTQALPSTCHNSNNNDNKSRAIAWRTARCRCKVRYVSKFTAASRGFSATARLSCTDLH